VIPSPRSDTRILVTKGPVGVAAAITPWNFLAAMITRTAGAALAAGCTVLIKPSELTPLTAFALGLLATESGIPAGVINIVTGDAPAIGEVWTSDPRVRKLTFTGSTAVGKRLAAACAPTLKRVSMELGGNRLEIPQHRTDVCVCANRLLVHESVYDAFTEPLFRFSSDAGALRIANATSCGLAAYMLTRDLGRALRISEALEAGMVGVNTGLISTEVAPFGAVKDSGIGREGSRCGIEEFLDVKYVCSGAV
jgi:acyl-CoA reductase-like NAD-dependent aldehyde dehydrogenase